jgi:hypothetical protein
VTPRGTMRNTATANLRTKRATVAGRPRSNFDFIASNSTLAFFADTMALLASPFLGHLEMPFIRMSLVSAGVSCAQTIA